MSSLSEASAKQDTDAAEQDPAAPEQVTKMPQPLPEEEVPDSNKENYLQPDTAIDQKAAEAEGVSANAGEEGAGDGGSPPSARASATALVLASAVDEGPTTGQRVLVFASSGTVLPSNANRMEINRILEDVFGIQGKAPRKGFLPISSLPLPFFLPFAFPRPSPTPSRAI